MKHLLRKCFCRYFEDRSREWCLDVQQPITVTRKLIDAVNVRSTEEAEPAAYGSIKDNQQLPSVVAGVNTAEPLSGPVAVLQPVKNLWTPHGATYGTSIHVEHL